MKYAFVCMWLFIALISAYDLYWTVRCAESLLQEERNPMGVWLIQQGDVALFVAVKSLGTMLVLGFLAWHYLRHAVRTMWMAGSLCVMQSFVFCYLNWGHLFLLCGT